MIGDTPVSPGKNKLFSVTHPFLCLFPIRRGWVLRFLSVFFCLPSPLKLKVNNSEGVVRYFNLSSIMIKYRELVQYPIKVTIIYRVINAKPGSVRLIVQVSFIFIFCWWSDKYCIYLSKRKLTFLVNFQEFHSEKCSDSFVANLRLLSAFWFTRFKLF